uniref:Uncharacterized protein n=1 Tax=Zooxanthella nutricula TaxID=1333877 RepID=A0A7S2VPL1_9DINO
MSWGAPTAVAPAEVNSTSCRPLSSQSRVAHPLDRSLADCSRFYCVSHELDHNFKKISESAYKAELVGCDGHILAPLQTCPSNEHCYLNAGAYFHHNVEARPIIKGGFAAGAGDLGGGIVALVLALTVLVGGLFGLVRLLHMLFMRKAKGVIVKATKFNDYVALLIGLVVTVSVQSSSVVTSALTPLCGLGLLPLVKMLPMTLGANIGTTVTALLAALSIFTHDAIHIALCHLFFNIFGVLIWFPLPAMRRVPLGAASLLGLYASYYRAVPSCYILVAFVLLPGTCLGVSSIFGADLVAGVVVSLVILGIFGAFEFWWIHRGGCYMVLSRDAREEGKRRLETADRRIRGESAEGA